MKQGIVGVSEIETGSLGLSYKSWERVELNTHMLGINITSYRFLGINSKSLDWAEFEVEVLEVS